MNNGQKRKPQKYQNKKAFKIQFDTQALDIQKKVSLHLLCKRCKEQLQWKLQYNKYKKITQPGKCNYCHNKNVVRSYMKACDNCAKQKEACPKCLETQYQLPQPSAKDIQKQQKVQQKAMNDYINTLRVRSKKKIARQLEKGIIFWQPQRNCFIDQEDKQVTGLHFKDKGFDGLDDCDDDNYSDQEDNLEQRESI